VLVGAAGAETVWVTRMVETPAETGVEQVSRRARRTGGREVRCIVLERKLDSIEALDDCLKRAMLTGGGGNVPKWKKRGRTINGDSNSKKKEKTML